MESEGERECKGRGGVQWEQQAWRTSGGHDRRDKGDGQRLAAWGLHWIRWDGDGRKVGAARRRTFSWDVQFSSRRRTDSRFATLCKGVGVTVIRVSTRFGIR